MANSSRESIVPYTEASVSLANGEDFDIDPADAPGGGPTTLEINQIVHGDDCDVKFLVDTDGDGTYEVNETIDSLTGSGISMGNELLVYETADQIIRITNTGSTADFSISGRVLSGVE